MRLELLLETRRNAPGCWLPSVRVHSAIRTAAPNTVQSPTKEHLLPSKLLLIVQPSPGLPAKTMMDFAIFLRSLNIKPEHVITKLVLFVHLESIFLILTHSSFVDFRVCASWSLDSAVFFRSTNCDFAPGIRTFFGLKTHFAQEFI